MLICFLHARTHTIWKHKKNRLFSYLPLAIVCYGRPLREIESLNSLINLIPKAPQSQRSSTAPPTSSTSTFFLTSVCLQLDSGWNTKVSENTARTTWCQVLHHIGVHSLKTCWLCFSPGSDVCPTMFYSYFTLTFAILIGYCLFM